MSLTFKKVSDGVSLILCENLLSSSTSLRKSKSKIFDFLKLVYSEQGLCVVPCS